MDWELIKSERGPDLKLFKVRYDYKMNPRNGKTVKVLVLESPDSVNVIAVTPKNEIVLIEQLRFGTNEITLELPGGLLNEPEEPEIAAQRELREETGYTGDGCIPLGSVSSNAVFMNNDIHHFIVRNATLNEAQELDDAETIKAILFPVERVREMFQDGRFRQPHTISALYRFFVYLDKHKGVLSHKS